MPRVEVTSHLRLYFPALKAQELEVHGSTAAKVIAAMEDVARGLGFYVSEDRGESWIAVSQNLPPIYSVRFG